MGRALTVCVIAIVPIGNGDVRFSLIFNQQRCRPRAFPFAPPQHCRHFTHTHNQHPVQKMQRPSAKHATPHGQLNDLWLMSERETMTNGTSTVRML